MENEANVPLAHRQFQSIRLSTPIVCKGYQAKLSETITDRAEIYLMIDSHCERTQAYIIE